MRLWIRWVVIDVDSIDILIDALSVLGCDVTMQGSYAEDEQLPADFFTYWINDSDDGNHYDNQASSTNDYISLNFYSTSPNNTYSYIKQVKKLLKEKGFIVSGNGYNIASGVTTHYGRAIDVIYVEREV